MNSVTIPIIPGEAAGCICKLTNNDKMMVINVEYSQIKTVLQGNIPTNEKGFS